MSRRRLYTPITRSGSSILASITTQLWQQSARTHQKKTYYDDCPEHLGIYFFIWFIFMFVFSNIAAFLGQHLAWWRTEPAGWLTYGSCTVTYLSLMAYLNHRDRAKLKQIRDKAEDQRRAEARRIIAMSYGNERPPEGEVREEWEKWHQQ
ncbi:hypothetical protein Gbem_2998 [Citrifermentans bemidjiense Bem]|uniref:Uncharacterized protein n=1 Tax=Citrifermentans bemidjiense (strain ATCC BAA-1014 / DSM 16622 / JCM 12645 / Bem) TaxID=404380 RepID=B5E832_CITBB|nr:hypothetical protein [Citrifermentans bemidjiense]ACH40001.1 hypothetical protein Gbem_2998 [Citrifermentans bemidjiense Bem]